MYGFAFIYSIHALQVILQPSLSILISSLSEVINSILLFAALMSSIDTVSFVEPTSVFAFPRDSSSNFSRILLTSSCIFVSGVSEYSEYSLDSVLCKKSLAVV